MELTLIRAKRTKEQNQERAYIAAARRTDRPFGQRLESLQKASELHRERTGRRFRVDQDQLCHRGPLEEIDKGGKKTVQPRRYMPCPPAWDVVGPNSSGAIFKSDVDATFWHEPHAQGFSPYQAQSFTLGTPLFVEAEKQPLSFVKTEDPQEMRIQAIQRHHVPMTEQHLKDDQTGTLHSQSVFPPSYFQAGQSEAQQHHWPAFGKEDVQKFINEYLLRPPPAFLTGSGSVAELKAPESTSAPAHLEEDGQLMGTGFEPIEQHAGEGDKRNDLTDVEEWDIEYMLNDNYEDDAALN